MAKEEIFQEVDQLKEVLHKSVKTIFAHPETGGKEIFSANYFRSELEKEGLICRNEDDIRRWNIPSMLNTDKENR